MGRLAETAGCVDYSDAVLSIHIVPIFFAEGQGKAARVEPKGFLSLMDVHGRDFFVSSEELKFFRPRRQALCPPCLEV